MNENISSITGRKARPHGEVLRRKAGGRGDRNGLEQAVHRRVAGGQGLGQQQVGAGDDDAHGHGTEEKLRLRVLDVEAQVRRCQAV
jgi:hypothetical protein